VSRRLLRPLGGATLALAALALVPVIASAHPLGNFTVNQYSGLVVRSDGVDVTYVLDMAEIPTAQLLSQLDSDEDHLLTAAAADRYRASECATVVGSITLRVGSATAPLTTADSALSFPAGAAGLHTLRLTCRLRTTGSVSPVGLAVTYTNSNFDDRVGWREITAAGSTARLASSDVPAGSVSAQLTSYPSDLLTSPLNVRSATVSVVAGPGGAGAGLASGPLSILPRGVDDFTSAFVGLISRQDVSPLFVLLALGLALVLGGVHAFAPGHGKTLMAAYLVGQRGSMRHAAALAGSVTLTHTLGVLALGVALSVSSSFAPTAVYPLLGVASGLLIVCIGLTLMLRAWRARRRPHAHDHHHDGDDHTHTHEAADAEPPRLRSVLALGFAGGMVPSPSALVVLVGGIALHRTWFAVILVVAYGVGMALALTGTGVALRHARTLLERRLARRRSTRGLTLARLASMVPVITAAAVIVVGVGLTLRGGGAI
jgi:ABC-type nickel/cobalt efflux system permease component RcnA